MRSVFRSLQQSARAALGGRTAAPIDPLAVEEARLADEARTAETLAHVGEIAYVEPSETLDAPIPADETTVAEAEADDSESAMYAALTSVLNDALQRSEQLVFPADLPDVVAMPEGWVRVPLMSWLERRGERSFKHVSGRAMLYRYFNVWEDGERQEMWSVYVSSPDKPDSRCISLPLALRMIERFQAPGFMPKNQLIAWRS